MAQEQTARVLDPQPEKYKLHPGQITRIKGVGRAIAVAKFRELADKLESGELDGARVQWLDTHECLVEDAEGIRYDLGKRERHLEKGEFDLARRETPPEGVETQPISGMEYVTRTPWTTTGEGRTDYVACWIEEVK